MQREERDRRRRRAAQAAAAHLWRSAGDLGHRLFDPLGPRSDEFVVVERREARFGLGQFRIRQRPDPRPVHLREVHALPPSPSTAGGSSCPHRFNAERSARRPSRRAW